MPMYDSLRSYVSRLHDVLGRKKNKPSFVISEPFGFKKEDALSQLPGIADEELHMLREKAAASIVGSAIAIRTYASAGDLADLVDLHAPYDAATSYSRASSSLSSSVSSSPLTPTTSDGFYTHAHHSRLPLGHHHSYALRHRASAASSFADGPGGAPPVFSSASGAVALTSHPTRTYSNATTASRSSSHSTAAGAGGTAPKKQHRIPRVAVGRPTAMPANIVINNDAAAAASAVAAPPESPMGVPPSPALSASAVPQRLLARNNRPLSKPKSLPTLRVELASTEPYAPSGLSAPPALVRASSMGSVREQAR